MKAAILYDIGQPLKIEELEMPAVNDEDVLIKTFACGVCHTDLKVVRGRNRFKPPAILGHEVSGIIERIGSRCKDLFNEGDAVIIGMRYKCGRCRYCLSARENLCANRPAPPSLSSPTARRLAGGMSAALPNMFPFLAIWHLKFQRALVWKRRA
jgi:S-(hydroxymethyl)glutathione dehydrogenase/alcohol dehydrogenase